LMAEREKRTGITQDRVLRELALLGFSDIAEFLEIAQGRVKIKDFDKLPPGRTPCIAEVCEFETEKRRRRLRFKLHDKVKTLELIGRHLGMFTDNVHQTGEVKHSGVLLTAPPMTKKEWFAFQKKLGKSSRK